MSVFVGRSHELARLKERFQEALEGRGNVVFVTGEAGAGKSTLIEQFLIEAAIGSSGLKIVDSTCSEQYGAGEPYQPFIEAFGELIREGGRAGGKASFLNMAKEIAPHWLQVIPVVGDVLDAGIQTAMTIRQKGTGTAVATQAASEEALFFQYTELLLAAAEQQPVILFIDDLHWADNGSVTLLSHVARKIQESRVFILGTYRPADVEATGHPIRKARQELQRYGIAEELEVTALDSEALGELLEERLGGPASPQLRLWMEQRAGTNPLFYGALADWLVDQGYAGERRGEWELVAIPEEIEIPRSAEGALERRLERLDSEVYRVLEYASVEGNEFTSVVLARLLDMDELQLEEKLEPIVRVHRLIRLLDTRDLPNGEIASVYLFSHSLVQDVLHGKLQGKRRILLHRRVAEILLDVYATDTSQVDPQLAVHFDVGRIPGRAYEFAVKAADRAAIMYAHLDAARLLSLALRNAQTDEEKIQVLTRLGNEQKLLGHYPEALRHYDEALKLAVAGADETAALSLKRLRIEVELWHSQRPAGELLPELKGLIREASKLGVDEDLCQLLWLLRLLPASVSASPAAYKALRRAVDIAERLDDPHLKAKARYELANMLTYRGSGEEAFGLLRDALGLCDETGDRECAGRCRNLLAVGLLLNGRYGEAIEEFDAAAAAFQEVGDPVNAAAVRNNLGGLLTRVGEWKRAEENLREALRVLRRLDVAARVLHPLHNLAELYDAKGDRAAAEEHWEALREQALETGYTENATIADCGMGLQCLEEGDPAGARKWLESAQARLGAAEDWTQSRELFHRLAARIAAETGDLEGALELVEVAEQELRSRDLYEWARFRLLRAEIQASQDAAGSAATVREALEVLEKLGAGPMARRAQALLARVEGA